MATFSNLGLKLITQGDEAGTWGTSTNTNLDIVDETFQYIQNSADLRNLYNT